MKELSLEEVELIVGGSASYKFGVWAHETYNSVIGYFQKGGLAQW